MPPDDWQTEFAAALCDPDAALPLGATPRRFAVYRNNIAMGQAEALAASFPAVHALVGPEFFMAMAAVYRQHSPPQSPVLAEWGSDFADFLASFPPLADWPYLPDVARLEFARLTALHARDATPIAITALGAVPASAIDGLVLRLHPSLHLIDSSWPVVSIYQAARTPGQGVDMHNAETGLVLRPQDHLITQVADAGLAALIAGMVAGQSLAVLAAQIGEADFAPALAALFALGGVIGWENADDADI